MVAKLGATDAADGATKLSAFFATAATNEKFMADSKVTLETLQASLTALEGKIVTEARIKEICGTSATEAISTWAASDAGKKIIGGEASRITMEALANVGTQPAKPAPAGNQDAAATVKGLIAEGKYAEAWALDKNLQAEFPTAGVYAAYAKAEANGRVSVNQPK